MSKFIEQISRMRKDDILETAKHWHTGHEILYFGTSTFNIPIARSNKECRPYAFICTTDNKYHREVVEAWNKSEADEYERE